MMLFMLLNVIVPVLFKHLVLVLKSALLKCLLDGALSNKSHVMCLYLSLLYLKCFISTLQALSTCNETKSKSVRSKLAHCFCVQAGS